MREKRKYDKNAHIQNKVIFYPFKILKSQTSLKGRTALAQAKMLANEELKQ